MTDQSKQGMRGFTLLESLIAVVVLVAAVAAITIPFSVGAMNEQEDARQTLAAEFANEILEEILSKDYPVAGSNLGAGYKTRPHFTDMGNYNGYIESAGKIADIAGAVVSDPQAKELSREVTVKWVYLAGQPRDEDATFLQIVVTVKHLDRSLCTLTRLVNTKPTGEAAS